MSAHMTQKLTSHTYSKTLCVEHVIDHHTKQLAIVQWPRGAIPTIPTGALLPCSSMDPELAIIYTMGVHKLLSVVSVYLSILNARYNINF